MNRTHEEVPSLIALLSQKSVIENVDEDCFLDGFQTITTGHSNWIFRSIKHVELACKIKTVRRVETSIGILDTLPPVL